MPLDVQAALAGASLWIGLALLFVGLIFVRNRRRLAIMLGLGVVLVVFALTLMVQMMGFGPDVAAPQ